jgi:hypothetical protein
MSKKQEKEIARVWELTNQALKMIEISLDLTIKVTECYNKSDELLGQTSDMLEASQEREGRLMLELHECQQKLRDTEQRLARLKDEEAQWKRGGLS